MAQLSATSSYAADEKPNQQWAILIGIEHYEKANPLVFTINDVSRLADTLRMRGGYRRDNMLELRDDAVKAALAPNKTNIMDALSSFLQKPGPNDTVLVFFSGHGFRDKENKMYLAPIDCDPANAAATGIPVAWFRDQIAACKANFKLLVLDACHAGSEKGEGPAENMGAKDLESFRDLEGVVTIASSTADQKSQIWDDKQQSLFSYWLNEGLKGHADSDGNGEVDIDELNKYVHRNVTATAKRRFPRPQTPVRIVRTGSPGSPVVLRLKPQPLKQVLNDMAGQLADAMEENKLGRVGVLEFTNETKLGELLGADFGLLGRYCAEELEHRLVDQGDHRFGVLDQRRLQQALRAQKFTLADLGSGDSLKLLASKTGSLPAIAQGTLRSRKGRVVTLQCKLLQTDSDDLAGAVGGSAVLDESEWAMLGKSASLVSEARKPAQPDPLETPEQHDAAVVHELDEAAQGPHPLADPKFPFRVRFLVNGKERKGVFKGNDYFIPVRKGEIYELGIDNNSNNPAMMRLLVDGLNTLPEREKTKGIETWLIGKRVNLSEARASAIEAQKKYLVRGWVTQTGANGKMDQFVIEDADKSLAARQNFSENIGLITVAFYERQMDYSRGTTGSMFGTGRGQELSGNLQEVNARCGELLGVVNIRYVDADTFSGQQN